MASNPLLGKRISLVSKKNIRYEGILYSINEQNATVALQNVTSFGTENRETTAFVAPVADAVYPFLLFRGQDIKDLHVHESTSETLEGTDDAPAQDAAAAPPPSPPKQVQQPAAATAPAPAKAPTTTQRSAPKPPQQTKQQKQPNRSNTAPVGTGASLLSNSRRGHPKPAPKQLGDFDFAANQEQFERVAGGKNANDDDDDDDDDEAGDALPDTFIDGGNDDDDDGFFDKISCDALEKQAGTDNRIRGAQERSLNTETFGADAAMQRRGRGGRGGGRRYNGRGGRGHDNGRGGRTEGGGREGSERGGGRGRGRGRGGAGRNSEYGQGSNNVHGRGRGTQRQQPMSAATSG